MGSFSRIEKTTGDKANYELYGSGDLHFGRLLHNRRFDIAMVAFLDCLKHLMDHIKSQDPSVDFPHQYVLSCSSKDDRLIADKGSQRIKSVMYPSNCSSIKKRLGLAHFVTYCWPLKFVSNGRPMVRTVDLVTGARSLYFDLPCAWSSSILICMKEGLTEPSEGHVVVDKIITSRQPGELNVQVFIRRLMS